MRGASVHSSARSKGARGRAQSALAACSGPHGAPVRVARSFKIVAKQLRIARWRSGPPTAQPPTCRRCRCHHRHRRLAGALQEKRAFRQPCCAARRCGRWASACRPLCTPGRWPSGVRRRTAYRAPPHPTAACLAVLASPAAAGVRAAAAAVLGPAAAWGRANRGGWRARCCSRPTLATAPTKHPAAATATARTPAAAQQQQQRPLAPQQSRQRSLSVAAGRTGRGTFTKWTTW